MIKYGSVGKALRTIDGGPQNKGTSDGMLSREEIINMLKFTDLLKYTDYYTGNVIGTIAPAVADTLIDFVDDDGNGQVSYQEFTKVLTADDIMHLPAPRSVVDGKKASSSRGTPSTLAAMARTTSGTPPCQGYRETLSYSSARHKFAAHSTEARGEGPRLPTLR